MRNAWNTVLKAKQEHTQARNSERSDGARGIVDTVNTKMTSLTLVKELVSCTLAILTSHEESSGKPRWRETKRYTSVSGLY